MVNRVVTLAGAPISASPLPREFCIFKSGVNESSKGPALFDTKAAELVMAAYRRSGTDVMLDLEHLSLERSSSRIDATDARGWCGLEIRKGELWAVQVRYTPDGARRLSEGTAKYISPAFRDDAEGRVVELVNLALVAMPATYNAPPLVKASRYGAKNSSTIAIRLSKEQRQIIDRKARSIGMLPGEFVRFAANAAALDADPVRVKKAICELRNVSTTLGQPSLEFSVEGCWTRLSRRSHRELDRNAARPQPPRQALVAAC